LPTIGNTAPALRGGASVEPPRMSDGRARVIPPRGRTAAINIALAVLAMLGIALGLRLAKRGELISHRVVIGVQGCGPACASRPGRSNPQWGMVHETNSGQNDAAGRLGCGSRRFPIVVHCNSRGCV